ncbi:MAG: asparaginase domain-containing protein [Rickettsiales bacterium]|nr:asparaginase domain-containing protein [Rickettsiales bacterium]
MASPLLLIRTGGTIDAKPYSNPKFPPQKITALKGDESTVAQLAQELHIPMHPWTEAEEERFVKDSASYNDGDIRALAGVIALQPQRHILVTHGTHFIAPNAAKIKALLPAHDKTVVFVGAMVPLSMQQHFPSDAKANINYALECLQAMGAGVYVIGRDPLTKQPGAFAPELVEKDHAASLATLSLVFNLTKLG